MLSIMNRKELEAIVLGETADHGSLSCSDTAVGRYLPDAECDRTQRLQVVLAAAHELLTRIAARDLLASPQINAPSAARDYLKVHFAGAQRESFVVIFLDAQHHVLAAEEMFLGTLSQTLVEPREVVRRALHYNAGALLLAHCHPSCVADPSQADRLLTDHLRRALAPVNVAVLDHIIVAGDEMYSFAEKGLLL